MGTTFRPKLGRKRVRVVVVGCGEWMRKAWVSTLGAMHLGDELHVTLQDVWMSPPEPVAALTREYQLDYVPASSVSDCHVAIILTNAAKQFEAACRVMRGAPSLRVLVLEKPGAFSREQAEALAAMASDRGVEIILADHYLLRPIFRHFHESRAKYFAKIGRVIEVNGWLTEASGQGPAGRSSQDLAPHLINLIHAIWPDHKLIVASAEQALAREAPAHLTDSFCRVDARMIGTGDSIPVRLTVGKLLTNRKILEIHGEYGCIGVDLAMNTLTFNGKEEHKCFPEWSYENLIRHAMGITRRAAAATPTGS